MNINETGLLDPLAQNFRVSGFDGGLFLSSIDLFFKSKQTPTESDTVRPVSIYLTETNGGLPTRNVIPFSEVTMDLTLNLELKSILMFHLVKPLMLEKLLLDLYLVHQELSRVLLQ